MCIRDRRWFGHVRRKLTDAPVWRVERINLVKTYCLIGMSGESRSMCLIQRNFLLVHVACPQILETNGLVDVVVVKSIKI